jgi:hypothetical protein
MWLDCGPYGRADLSRITPTIFVAKAVHDIPPCTAVLTVTLDGRPISTRVNISGFASRRATRTLADA